MRHKGVKTISDSGIWNRISVSGKIGNVNPAGIIMQGTTPSIFYGEKNFLSAIEYDTANGAMRLANIAQSGQCHNLSLEHHLHHALKGLLPIRDALYGI